LQARLLVVVRRRINSYDSFARVFRQSTRRSNSNIISSIRIIVADDFGLLRRQPRC